MTRQNIFGIPENKGILFKTNFETRNVCVSDAGKLIKLLEQGFEQAPKMMTNKGGKEAAAAIPVFAPDLGCSRNGNSKLLKHYKSNSSACVIGGPETMDQLKHECQKYIWV